MGKYTINNNDHYIREYTNLLTYHVFHTNRDFSITVKGPIKSNDVGGVAIV